MTIHPEAIEATERLYNAWRTGKDVRVTDVINEALDKALSKPKPQAPTNDIPQIVCDYLNISRKLIFKDRRGRTSREKHIVMARWFCFLFLRDTGLSLSRIARIFGVTHGAVLNGLNRLRTMMDVYPEHEGRQFKELKKLIQQKP